MLEDTLKGWVVKWAWRKHIKQCQQRTNFWGDIERIAIVRGIDHEKIVLVGGFRQSYEEAVATLRNPDKTEKDMEECLIKLEACLKREKTFLEALRSKDFELADRIMDNPVNQS